MSLKDIRKHTIGTKTKLKEVIKTFKTEDGIEFEVLFRQPTRRDKKELIKKCSDENGMVEVIDLSTWAVIMLARDPETGERVFTDEDYDSFMEQASVDSFVEEFALEALRLVNGVNGEPNDPKELPEG